MLTTDYVLGIDPGAKGALCLLSRTGEVKFKDMPKTYKEWRLVYRWLLSYAADLAQVACEDVHSLYGMSAKSNFQFGGMVKTIQTIVGMAVGDYAPYQLIQPKQWQKEIGLVFPKGTKSPERKLFALARAKCLIGEEVANEHFYGSRGGLLDGRVDAYLIAYCLLQRELMS